MAAPRTITIDGKRHLWRDILKLRREQAREAVTLKQPALFPLIDDSRPAHERTVAGRYLEPSLFTLNERDERTRVP